MESQIRAVGTTPFVAEVADKRIYREDDHLYAQDIWVKGEFPLVGETINGWSGRETYIRLHNIASRGMPPRLIPALDVKETESAKTIWTRSNVQEGSQINGLTGREWIVNLRKTTTPEGVEFQAQRGMIR